MNLTIGSKSIEKEHRIKEAKEWRLLRAEGAARSAALEPPRVFGFVFGQCKKENPADKRILI